MWPVIIGIAALGGLALEATRKQILHRCRKDQT